MTTTERDALIKRQLSAHVTYTHVAKAHGISRQTVYALAKRMGIESPDAYSARILAEMTQTPAPPPPQTAEDIFANWGKPEPTTVTQEQTKPAAEDILANWGRDEE